MCLIHKPIFLIGNNFLCFVWWHYEIKGPSTLMCSYRHRNIWFGPMETWKVSSINLMKLGDFQNFSSYDNFKKFKGSEVHESLVGSFQREVFSCVFFLINKIWMNWIHPVQTCTFHQVYCPHSLKLRFRYLAL